MNYVGTLSGKYDLGEFQIKVLRPGFCSVDCPMGAAERKRERVRVN